MGRPRINQEPLTNAEKQARYRSRQKEKLEALKAIAQAPAEPVMATPSKEDLAVLRESVKAELRESWEPELKAQRIAAERKQGRELAKRADQSHARGRVIGICEAASFFIGKGRTDITQSLLSHFMIDREKAKAALEADRRVRSLTLESLDKAGAWGAPPAIIK
jgi:hypothetical protein